MFLTAKTVQRESTRMVLVVFGILPDSKAQLLKTRELLLQFISKNKQVSSGILLAIHIEMSAWERSDQPHFAGNQSRRTFRRD
jgi:hypothetical protein